MIPNSTIQTKDLASRYERNLQDSEATTEKSKARLDTTMEELGRILLQKEGEPAKDSVIQTRAPAGGKRAIGKAVAKGGLLLKGKNPGNVPSPSILCDLAKGNLLTFPYRFNARKTISVLVCSCLPRLTTSQCRKRRVYDRNILTSNSLGYSASVPTEQSSTKSPHFDFFRL